MCPLELGQLCCVDAHEWWRLHEEQARNANRVSVNTAAAVAAHMIAEMSSVEFTSVCRVPPEAHSCMRVSAVRDASHSL